MASTAVAAVWQTTEVVQPAPVDGKVQQRQRVRRPNQVPLNTDELHKSVAAAAFATGVDIPVRLADVPRTPRPGADPAGKQQLWDFYHRDDPGG